VFVGSAADYWSSVAHGLAFGVLTHVGSRGHSVHGCGRDDVVPPSPPPSATAATTAATTAAADAAFSHRTDSPLSTAATAPPHHRSPARHDLPIAPPEPGRDVTPVTVTRFGQDVVLGLMKNASQRRNRIHTHIRSSIRLYPSGHPSIHPLPRVEQR